MMKAIEDSQIKRAIHILKKVGHGYLYGPDREVSEAFVLAIQALRAHLEHRIPVIDRDLEKAEARIEALEEALGEALTWESRLNKSEQLAGQGTPQRQKALAMRGVVVMERENARTLLSTTKEDDRGDPE